MKKWLRLTAAGLLFFAVSFMAWAREGQGMEAVTNVLETEEAEVEQKTGLYEEIGERLDSAEIYELTENQFQDGLDYELANEELEALRMLLKSGGLTSREGAFKKEDIKYILDLYDEEERELASFGISGDGSVYSDKEEEVDSEKLQEWIQAFISEKSER